MLVNLSIPGARLNECAGKINIGDISVIGVRPYEQKYSCGNSDIYACEPQHSRGKAQWAGWKKEHLEHIAPYEHQDSKGKTDTYAHEPQYYQGKTERTGEKNKSKTLGRQVPPTHPQSRGRTRL